MFKAIINVSDPSVVRSLSTLKVLTDISLLIVKEPVVDSDMSSFCIPEIVNGIDVKAIERMKWFDHLSAGKQLTDFFANRVTNYSKGVQDWDAASIF